MKNLVLFSFFALSLPISSVPEKIDEQSQNEKTIMVHFDPGLINQVIRAEQEMAQKYSEKAYLASIEGIVQEARKKYGIDPQKTLPIKDMDPTSPEAQLFAAHGTNDAVMVNRATLYASTFGTRRITLFHEISHENDSDFKVLTNTSTFAGLAAAVAHVAFFLKKKGLNRKSMWGLPMAAGTFLISKVCVRNIHHHYVEHKADTNALKHAECSQCAKELALDRKALHARTALQEEIQEATNSSFLNTLLGRVFKSRYLSSEEIGDFPQILENKKCEGHQIMAEYPILEKFIEHKYTALCNAFHTAAQELREKNKLSRLKRIAELHEQRSQGPLLADFV